MKENFHQLAPLDTKQTTTVIATNYVLSKNVTISKDISFQQFKPLLTAGSSQSLPSPIFIERNFNSQTAVFTIYFLTLVIWAILYRRNGRDFSFLFKNFIDNNAFIKSINDNNGFNGLATLAFFLLGIVSFSTFLFLSDLSPKSILLQENLIKSPIAILFIGFGVMFWFFLKTLIIYSSTWILQTRESLNTYLSLNIISFQVLGIILLPISILISFATSINTLVLHWLGFFLILLFFTYRITRTFLLAVKQTNSQWVHILLYICTLEILPLLPLSKLLNW